MGSGATRGLWRNQTWSPSWILSRIRNEVKTLRTNNILSLRATVCKYPPEIDFWWHKFKIRISNLPVYNTHKELIWLRTPGRKPKNTRTCLAKQDQAVSYLWVQEKVAWLARHSNIMIKHFNHRVWLWDWDLNLNVIKMTRKYCHKLKLLIKVLQL